MPVGEYPAVVSGRYPLTADPEDLQRCVIDHARALERNLEHHKTHSSRIGALELSTKSQDARLDTLAIEVARLRSEFKTMLATAAATITVLVTVGQILIAWVSK